MSRQILVYGHGDKSSEGFETPESLVKYLEGGIFHDEDGRYRYSQTKSADVIVLARDGLAFGHFEIDAVEAPTDADREAYPPVKKVYVVRKSVRYGGTVHLSPLGISNYQFGRYITHDQFEQILKLAGINEEFRANYAVNVTTLAQQINEAAAAYRVGALQQLRSKLHGRRARTQKIFSKDTIHETEEDNYAHHDGGRTELQFNVGLELRDQKRFWRHGVAFSFEKSQTLPDPRVLRPKVGRFNIWIRSNADALHGFRMWDWGETLSIDRAPGEILEDGICQ